MKKTYETPSVEVVKFQYRDQVVAASGNGSYTCHVVHSYEGADGECSEHSVWQSEHA